MRVDDCHRLGGWLAAPMLLAQAAAPTLAAPVVAALPALSIFILAGSVGGAAGLLLLPLRLRGGLQKRSRPGEALQR